MVGVVLEDVRVWILGESAGVETTAVSSTSLASGESMGDPSGFAHRSACARTTARMASWESAPMKPPCAPRGIFSRRRRHAERMFAGWNVEDDGALAGPPPHHDAAAPNHVDHHHENVLCISREHHRAARRRRSSRTHARREGNRRKLIVAPPDAEEAARGSATD